MSPPNQWLIEAAPWQWALCIVLPFAAAWWMYGRGSGTQKTTTGGGMGLGGRMGLALLRTTVLVMLAFLLLEPLIRSIQLNREEPVVILLLDESASVLRSADSIRVREQLRAWPMALSESLNEQGMALETFGFSSELNARDIEDWSTTQWDGGQTNLEAAIKELEARFENRNLAGLILASDGLINRGAQPEYSSHWPATPLYTIGLGDTTTVRDRWIERVDHNRVAYLGNTFPVEVVVQSQGMAHDIATIEVLHRSKTIATQTWDPTSNQTSERFEFMLPAEGLGMQRYEVRCNIGANEANTNNNRFPFYVDVLESKRQVLIVSDAPHPDINALALALQEQDQTEVEVLHTTNLKDANALLGAIEKADVLIAHNVLGQSFGAMSWPRLIEMNQKPCWWILSDDASQTGLASMSDWGVRLEQSRGLTETHRIRLNPNFGLFEVSDAVDVACSQWPPMQGPFGSISWSPAWNPLFYRQLGNLETEQACWAVREPSADLRMAITVGQGFWNWRMRNYLQNESHDAFNGLIQRQVQFLGSEQKKDRLSIATPQTIEVDQRFELTAEVYDAALLPVNGATIDLLLKSEDGAEFTAVFIERNQRYVLDAGRLEAGSYNWVASCQLDRELFEQSGTVIVHGMQAEQNSKPADHNLLLRLSERTGGAFCGILDDTATDRIRLAMERNGSPAAILHEQVKLNELIAWESILWCLLALLTIEWVVRRRAFGY